MSFPIMFVAAIGLSLRLSGQEVLEAEVAPALEPRVETEEEVYSYDPADNGADPMWCWGSTCLVRIGDEVFASGLETLKQAKPLNNVRWMLLRRGPGGWKLEHVDETGRTREPCPIVGYPDGRLFLSANPTLVADPDTEGRGPARPEILRFDARDPEAPYDTLLPAWDGDPAFSEHSYRTFAADGRRGELILFQNVGLSHSEWVFRDRDGRWAATGKLVWPPVAQDEVEPYGASHARCNYANVVLSDRAVHFCGAAAYDHWDRVDAPELMGRGKWGSRWRRLYYTWTPDIKNEPFDPWLEVANTFADGGWLFPGDMWIDAEGAAHIVWYEHPIHKQLRDEHFPDITRTYALKHAVIRNGEIRSRRVLLEGGEGISSEIPGALGSPRVQVTPNGRTFIVYFVGGTDGSGRTLSENRVAELLPDGGLGPPVRVPLRYPMKGFFTATPRGGSAPSKVLDLLGARLDAPHTIGYARVRLW